MTQSKIRESPWQMTFGSRYTRSRVSRRAHSMRDMGHRKRAGRPVPQQDTWVHNLVLTPQEEPFIPTEVESKDTGEGLDEA